MSESDDLQFRILASNLIFRAIFGVLAVVVPLGLGVLFHQAELRLRALADHGRAATAVVTSVEESQGRLYTHYRYDVDGASYTRTVAQADAPVPVGGAVPITYLPEDPSFSQPGTYTPERRDADLDLGFQHRLLGGLFAFFALAAGLCHRGVVRQRKGLPPRARPLVGPVGLGRILGLVFVAIGVGSTFDPKGRVVFTKLFGASPFGLPVTTVCAVATGILFAPLVWVLPHLMTIVMESAARGGSLSHFGVVMAVVNADPSHRRSRRIVVVGLLYLLAVFAAWIAYSQSHGV